MLHTAVSTLSFCALFIEPLIATNGIVSPTTYQALKLFFEAANGTHWNWASTNITTHWTFLSVNYSLPCSGWQGISCTGNNVTTISLFGVGLGGYLSPNISSIATLQVLNLKSNYLSGVIPSTLCSLVPTVTSIDLSGSNTFTCYSHCLAQYTTSNLLEWPNKYPVLVTPSTNDCLISPTIVPSNAPISPKSTVKHSDLSLAAILVIAIVGGTAFICLVIGLAAYFYFVRNRTDERDKKLNDWLQRFGPTANKHESRKDFEAFLNAGESIIQLTNGKMNRLSYQQQQGIRDSPNAIVPITRNSLLNPEGRDSFTVQGISKRKKSMEFLNSERLSEVTVISPLLMTLHLQKYYIYSSILYIVYYI
jgi:hypothetical protein